MRFGPYLAFITLWSLVVYAPVAHWVWGGGFLAKLGALDFAGGTVVHVNAGAAALVAALVLGPRKDYARQAILPHNVPFVAARRRPALVRLVRLQRRQRARRQRHRRPRLRQHACSPRPATLVVWTLLDLVRTGKATAVGAATGIVVGLVAITPAAGFVEPDGARSCSARSRRSRATSRCSAARARGSTTRSTWSPRTASAARWARCSPASSPQKAWNGTVDGLLFGNPGQLGIQARRRRSSTIAYSGVATLVLLKLIGARDAARRATREEGLGLDVSQHGEEAYADDEGAILILQRPAAAAPLPRRRSPPRRRKEAAHEARRGRSSVRRRLNDVLEALFRAEVQGLTISRVQGHGGETEQVETYRGTTVKMELSREGPPRDRRLRPLRRADREGDPRRGPHRRRRRRQDLRPAGREGLPHPHRRGGPGRGHAGPGGRGRQGLKCASVYSSDNPPLGQRGAGRALTQRGVSRLRAKRGAGTRLALENRG